MGTDEQLPILYPDERPLARRDDPLSSHAAADRMQRSGKLALQRERVLKLVRAYPGLTSRQLGSTVEAERTGLDRYAVARRLPDLEELGFVRRSDPANGAEIRWFPCVTAKHEQERLGG